MIYFDITDTLEFMYRANGITGIQRVVLSSLHALQEQGKSAKLLFCNYHSGKTYSVELDSISFHSFLELIPKYFFDSPVTQAEYLSVVAERLQRLEIQSGDKVLLLGGTWNYPQATSVIKDWIGKGVAVTQFVHDMLPISEPHLFSNDRSVFVDFFNELKDLPVSLATSTEYNKTQILNFLGNPKKKVIVSAFGDEFIPFRGNPGINQEIRNLKGVPFALMVGTIEPRKLHSKVMKLWCEERLYEHMPLMICGGRGWNSDEFIQLYHDVRKVTDRVFWIENIFDDELQFVYNECQLVIYPTMLEGWGLPASEALAAGKRCITGNHQSLLHHRNSTFVDFHSSGFKSSFVAALKAPIVQSDAVPRKWTDFIAEILES